MPSPHQASGWCVTCNSALVQITPGSAWFGTAATGASYRRGRDSDLAIPSIGAAESLPRLRSKGLRGAKRRDATVGSALARDLARLQDRGAGGMATLAARAPLLTLRRVARAVGAAGIECASAPTWPEGAKGRQPAPPARHVPLGGRSPAGGSGAVPPSARRLHDVSACTAADRSGAPRARL